MDERGARQPSFQFEEQLPAADSGAGRAADAGQDAGALPVTGADPAKKPPKPLKSREVLAYEAARKQYFQSTIWRPWLAPVLALLSICLVTSLLLGLTNALTAPYIAANQQAEAESTRKNLLPAADGFTQVTNDGFSENVTAMYKANNGVGWVVEASAQGYGGMVPVTVAFDASGVIAGVQFPENNETPGLGQKLVTDPGFATQFSGRPPQQIEPGGVDKLASATISTGAAVTAVNAAIQAYNMEALGQADAESSAKEAS